MENVATRKRDSKEAVEPYYTGWSDQHRKRRSYGPGPYKIVKSNDSINTWLVSLT